MMAKMGEIPSPVHSPKNSNSRKYNVIYKYIYMSMCGQTHLGNGGKMVRLVFDQKKIELA